MEDSLAALLEELRGLPAGRRSELLALLDTSERNAIQALMDNRPASEAMPADASASMLAQLSPWLRERLQLMLEPGDVSLTDAARKALHEAFAGLGSARPDPFETAPDATPSLSARLRDRFRPVREAA